MLVEQVMRVALVGVDFGKEGAGHFAAGMAELALLVESAAAEPVVQVCCKRARPDPAFFIGSGKADELLALIAAHNLDAVVFNHALAPAQQRNLEDHLNVPVVDRTSLILDIFAKRAQSQAGKLQVELAQLEFMSTRLVRRWTHLERQKGGIGMRGGPGETQIELDRRMLTDRIKTLKQKLSKLEKQRASQRRGRARTNTFTISLVGYTNAGKSTLFNALTHANTYAANQLFATLDTTSRRLYLGADASLLAVTEAGVEDAVGVESVEGTDSHAQTEATYAHHDAIQVVLSDTVGFIRDLPHNLVAAFRATLEETVHADLLLHVVDAAAPERDEQIAAVNAVLKEINIGQTAEPVAQIMVCNKVDLLDLANLPELQSASIDAAAAANLSGCDTIPRIYVSAKTGAGLDTLRQALAVCARQARAERIAYPDGVPMQAYDPLRS
jgi:GTP-binding protein HflX